MGIWRLAVEQRRRQNPRLSLSLSRCSDCLSFSFRAASLWRDREDTGERALCAAWDRASDCVLLVARVRQQRTQSEKKKCESFDAFVR